MTRNLTSGRTLFRGAIWNLLGQSLPVVAAFLFVPLLVRGLGIERFGILSLAWMLVGYFSLFDLGLGGALTRLVSDRLANRQDEEVPGLVWTALALTFPLGLVGGAITMTSFSIPVVTFMKEVESAVSFTDFMAGFVKSFVFAILIAGIGCLRGLQTAAGASAVGESATRAVVSGIILLVVVDGIFAVAFYILNV